MTIAVMVHSHLVICFCDAEISTKYICIYTARAEAVRRYFKTGGNIENRTKYITVT